MRPSFSYSFLFNNNRYNIINQSTSIGNVQIRNFNFQIPPSTQYLKPFPDFNLKQYQQNFKNSFRNAFINKFNFDSAKSCETNKGDSKIKSVPISFFISLFPPLMCAKIGICRTLRDIDGKIQRLVILQLQDNRAGLGFLSLVEFLCIGLELAGDLQFTLHCSSPPKSRQNCPILTS